MSAGCDQDPGSARGFGVQSFLFRGSAVENAGVQINSWRDQGRLRTDSGGSSTAYGLAWLLFQAG